MTREQAQFLFDSTLRSQFAWRRKAAQLYRVGIRTLESASNAKSAAQAIIDKGSVSLTLQESESLEDYKLYEVGFFLLALSIENLLKAIWASKNHARISGITDIRKNLKGLANHDLARLAHSANLMMTDDENSLLDALRDIIMWSGRYPTPLCVGKYQQTMINGAPTNRFIRDQCIFSIELPLPVELAELFSKLMDEIQAIPDTHDAS